MSNARKLADNLPTEGSLSGRNVIVNGGMTVTQRGSSQTGVGVDTFTNIDRFKQYASVGGMAGRSTSTQETITDLKGFTKALKLQVTTADTSVGSTESYGLNTRLEADDILRFGIGTANAQAITLSFYAKAPTGGGVFCAGISLPGGGNYFEEVTIGTSWARHEIKIPVTTTSSHATTATGTAAGIEVQITLMAGSSYNTLTNKTWSVSGAKRATSNQTNFYSSTSNNLFITGLQLEAGPQSTPFEHEPFGVTLSKCERYFYKLPISTYGPFFCNYVTSHRFAHIWFPVRMRTTPTSTTTNAGGTIYEYHPDPYHTKYYVTASYDSGSSVYLQSFQADAEL